MHNPGTFGDRLRRWARRQVGGLQGPMGAFAALVVLAALLLGLAGTIWLPASASIHTTMKVLHFNDGGYAINQHVRGCGNYWDTRQVGHGMGTTIQLAAGFCWNGKKVWWVWGLHQGNCSPIAFYFTQVHMTCQISGEGGPSMNVMYEAQVTSSLFPFVRRTLTLQMNVTAQGYVLQLPFQPTPVTRAG